MLEGTFPHLPIRENEAIDVKLCKDCRYLQPIAPNGRDVAACLHPDGGTYTVVDPVSGHAELLEPHQRNAPRSMRQFGAACGPEAKLFEAKGDRGTPSFLGFPIVIDPSLGPGEWRLVSSRESALQVRAVLDKLIGDKP